MTAQAESLLLEASRAQRAADGSGTMEKIGFAYDSP